MADKDLAEKYLESFSDVFADIYNVLLFRKEILLEEGLEEGPTIRWKKTIFGISFGIL